MSIAADNIWRPDLVIMNVIEDEAERLNLAMSPNRVIIRSDGEVTWFVRKTMKTSCSIDVAFFPYDTQICPIKVSKMGLCGKFSSFVVRYDTRSAIDSRAQNIVVLIFEKTRTSLVNLRGAPLRHTYIHISVYLHLPLPHHMTRFKSSPSDAKNSLSPFSIHSIPSLVWPNRLLKQ